MPGGLPVSVDLCELSAGKRWAPSMEQLLFARTELRTFQTPSPAVPGRVLDHPGGRGGVRQRPGVTRLLTNQRGVPPEPQFQTHSSAARLWATVASLGLSFPVLKTGWHNSTSIPPKAEVRANWVHVCEVQGQHWAHSRCSIKARPPHAQLF